MQSANYNILEKATGETDKVITCYAPDVWSPDYVKKIWCGLEPKCNATFFQSFPWIDAWLTVAYKHVTPVVFRNDKGENVGICFIGRGKTRDFKMLSFDTVFYCLTGEKRIDVLTTEYNDILVLPDYAEAARKALIDFFLSDKKLSAASRYMFERAPKEIVENFTRPDLKIRIFKQEESVVVRLKEAATEKELFTKSFQTKIRRSIKYYEDNYGAIKFERAVNVTKAQNWFAELGKLNQLRYRKKGQKSAWDYPELVRAHRAFLDRNYTKGAAELIRVKAGDKIIGYLYNFIYRGRVYFYMSGFEFENDNKAKPGLMTHYYCILDHYRNGLEIYDFMAGDYRYKYEIGVPGEKMVSFYLDKPSYKTSVSDTIDYVKQKIKGLCGKNG